MTPGQRTALETLVGRELEEGEVDAIRDHIAAGDLGAIAGLLSAGRTRIERHYISERGVRALAVLPRHRYALLTTLRSAEMTVPSWLSPALVAAGVPVDDHPALADDLASAHRWLLQDAGIDVGSSAARSMLALIAAAVPEAAPACVAVLALAEVPDPIDWRAVHAALEAAQ